MDATTIFGPDIEESIRWLFIGISGQLSFALPWWCMQWYFSWHERDNKGRVLKWIRSEFDLIRYKHWSYFRNNWDWSLVPFSILMLALSIAWTFLLFQLGGEDPTIGAMIGLGVAVAGSLAVLLGLFLKHYHYAYRLVRHQYQEALELGNVHRADLVVKEIDSYYAGWFLIDVFVIWGSFVAGEGLPDRLKYLHSLEEEKRTKEMRGLLQQGMALRRDLKQFNPGNPRDLIYMAEKYLYWNRLLEGIPQAEFWEWLEKHPISKRNLPPRLLKSLQIQRTLLTHWPGTFCTRCRTKAIALGAPGTQVVACRCEDHQKIEVDAKVVIGTIGWPPEKEPGSGVLYVQIWSLRKEEFFLAEVDEIGVYRSEVPDLDAILTEILMKLREYHPGVLKKVNISRQHSLSENTRRILEDKEVELIVRA